MVDIGPLSAPLTDVVRAGTVVAFAAVAWRDIRTRRVPSIYWAPLTLVGIVLLALDGQRAAALGGYNWEEFLIVTGVGISFLVSLAFLFHYVGAFGGADARALMTIAVLYPVYPEVTVSQTFYPLVISPLPIFSLTILTNTVVGGIIYPFGIAGRNLLGGTVSSRMFVGLAVDIDDVPTTYGKLLDRRGHSGFLDRLRTLIVPRRRGLDLDALRMYLRWRGLTLAELREQPAHYRDPETIPTDPNPPTDGAIESAAGPQQVDLDSVDLVDTEARPGEAGEDGESESAAEYADAWGAEAFLSETDAYGTTAETLRYGLDKLADEDEVWVSPGIPFLVPIFLGIVISFTYGDVFVSIMRAVGLL